MPRLIRTNNLILLVVIAGWCIVMVTPILINSLLGNVRALDYMEYFISDDGDIIPEPIDNNLYSQILYGLVLLRSGDTSGAIQQLDNERIISNSFGASIYANAIFTRGDYSEAIDIWLSISDKTSLISGAKELLELEEQKWAEYAYEQLYIQNPRVGLLPYVDYLIYHQKEYEKAEKLIINDLRRLLFIDDRVNIYQRLVFILRSQNRLSDAEQVVYTALKEYPGNLILLIDLGWIYFEQGRDFEDVEGKFLEAIELNKKRGEGYFALGESTAQKGDFARADGWFEKAVGLNPEKQSWYLVWANRARDAGRIDRAIEIYRSYIARFPEEANGYYQLAVTYAAKGDPLALETIKLAIEISKSRNEIYFVQAGLICEQFDLMEEAIGYYQQAMKINPNNGIAQKNLSKLQAP